VSYGEGVTYWPLVEVVRQAAGLTGNESGTEARNRLSALLVGAPDADRVVAAIAFVAGLGGTAGAPEETAWALRRLLEELSRERPVLLLVDDLHWAEPGLVQVLDDVVEMLDARVLVVVMARPELLDDTPTWGAARTNARTLRLEALDPASVDALTRGLLGATPPADVAQKVREFAGGNPLYLEQLVEMLVEEQVLVRERSGWTVRGDLTSIAVPATISALLSARLDRLSGPERAAIGAASVVGQLFYPEAVAAIADLPDADEHLEVLVRKGLLHRAETDLPDVEALRFGHVLVRDAAYATLPKRVRAQLHERFARWLDAARRGPAYDDFVGSHLEAAHRNLSELGVLDVQAQGLGREASDRLAAAGRRLLWADDAAAGELLQRADRLRRDQGPSRWALQIEMVEAWSRHLSSLVRAGRLAAEVEEAAEAADDEAWALRARLLRAIVALNTHPEGASEVLRRAAERALTLFAGDHAGLATAHEGLAQVASMVMDVETAAREARLAAEHARLAGRPRQASEDVGRLLYALVFGRTDGEVGLRETCQLNVSSTDRYGEVVTSAAKGLFEALLGHGDEAELTWSTAEERAFDVRSDLWAVVLDQRALAAIHTGDWLAAQRLLARLSRFQRTAGAIGNLSTVVATHAYALLMLGHPDAARRHVAVARASAASDDVVTTAIVSSVLAWLAAHEGRPAEAREQITTAIEVLPVDVLLDRALVHLAGAEVETLLRQPDAAGAHRRATIALYEEKGNVVGAARQRALL
jgi:hypothetical protein